MGEVTLLPNGDVPIGLFPEMVYQELQITLSSGCAIVVYSDGLIDALNPEGEEFGEKRLVGWCRQLPKGASPESICTSLSQRVAEWSGCGTVRRYDYSCIGRELIARLSAAPNVKTSSRASSP
jgi:serine phosphatase RsbU (regulator of sigma subunit)